MTMQVNELRSSFIDSMCILDYILENKIKTTLNFITTMIVIILIRGLDYEVWSLNQFQSNFIEYKWSEQSSKQNKNVVFVLVVLFVQPAPTSKATDRQNVNQVEPTFYILVYKEFFITKC